MGPCWCATGMLFAHDVTGKNVTRWSWRQIFNTHDDYVREYSPLQATLLRTRNTFCVLFASFQGGQPSDAGQSDAVFSLHWTRLSLLCVFANLLDSAVRVGGNKKETVRVSELCQVWNPQREVTKSVSPSCRCDPLAEIDPSDSRLRALLSSYSFSSGRSAQRLQGRARLPLHAHNVRARTHTHTHTHEIALSFSFLNG